MSKLVEFFVEFLDGFVHFKGQLLESYKERKKRDKELERELDHEIYSWANRDEIERFKYVVDCERALESCIGETRKIAICNELLNEMEYRPITKIKKDVMNTLKEMRQSGFPDGTVADKKNYIERKDAFELFLEVIK